MSHARCFTQWGSHASAFFLHRIFLRSIGSPGRMLLFVSTFLGVSNCILSAESMTRVIQSQCPSQCYCECWRVVVSPAMTAACAKQRQPRKRTKRLRARPRNPPTRESAVNAPKNDVVLDGRCHVVRDSIVVQGGFLDSSFKRGQKYGGCRTASLPTTYVEGKRFVRVSTTDGDWCRLMTGQALYERPLSHKSLWSLWRTENKNHSKDQGEVVTLSLPIAPNLEDVHTFRAIRHPGAQLTMEATCENLSWLVGFLAKDESKGSEASREEKDTASEVFSQNAIFCIQYSLKMSHVDDLLHTMFPCPLETHEKQSNQTHGAP